MAIFLKIHLKTAFSMISQIDLASEVSTGYPPL